MATIVSDLTALQIGKDFVDAVTGATACHGVIEIGHRLYEWQSTLPIADTEHALREAAKQEHKRVSLFISQAV